MLTLYPDTVLNLFISLDIIFVMSLGFVCMRSCHVRTEIILLPPFKSLDVSDLFINLFIDLSFLTAMAKTTSTMLHRRGKTQHSYMLPDLRGKVFSLSPLSVMLAVVLHIRLEFCHGDFLQT